MLHQFFFQKLVLKTEYLVHRMWMIISNKHCVSFAYISKALIKKSISTLR